MKTAVSTEPSSKRSRRAKVCDLRESIQNVSKKVELVDRTWVVQKDMEENEEIFRILPHESVSLRRILEIESKFEDLLKLETVHPIHDCIIALFLANQTAGKNNYQAYVDALPRDHYLPRHWDANRLKVLQGSPLLSRINQQKEDLLSDFAKIKSAYWDSDNVPFEEWDRAMAWVTSRAFHNPKGHPVMVPCLDMCDHHTVDHKNVSYEFETDGTCVAKASCPISQNQHLAITYGAQSNAQLLYNYGFCIERTPDTYHLDSLEFTNTIFLRRGPKSFTYGPFCQALDTYLDESNEPTSDKTPKELNSMADIEDFLDGCEEEEEGEEFGFEDELSSEEDDPGKDEQIEAECLALFESRLLKIQQKYLYSLEDTEKRVMAREDDFYPAILLESEHRIIRFCLAVIAMIQARLQTGKSKSFSLSSRDQSYAEELRDVYFSIRHS